MLQDSRTRHRVSDKIRRTLARVPLGIVITAICILVGELCISSMTVEHYFTAITPPLDRKPQVHVSQRYSLHYFHITVGISVQLSAFSPVQGTQQERLDIQGSWLLIKWRKTPRKYNLIEDLLILWPPTGMKPFRVGRSNARPNKPVLVRTYKNS